MPTLVHNFVAGAVTRFGTASALSDARGTLSYLDLWNRSARLAGALDGLGVRRGDRVAALMNNRNEWVEVDLAVSMIGGIRCRLNSRDGDREYAWVLNDARPRVVIAGPEHHQRIRALVESASAPTCRVIALGDAYESLISGATPASPREGSDSDPYLIFHTSGTTGNYKGAVYLQRNWIATYRNILATVMDDVGPESSILHVGPLSHQSGILINPGLFLGARSVMLETFTPESFFDVVRRERITHTILAPAIINALVSHPAARTSDLSSLRRIFYSGSPIAPTVLRRAIDIFGPILLQGFGSSEGGTIYNTILYPNEHVDALGNHPERLASCGRPSPFFEVVIADQQGNEVPVGEVGELRVRGDAVSIEYWNQPDVTATAYVDGFFCTGDLATRDADGYVSIVDRKNDVIISGGLNVYPREVEDVIAGHPAVKEVVVIGVPDDRWGESVKACVSLRAGVELSLTELEEHCHAEGLASYKKPRSLDIIDEIPKTAVGKPFRRILREPHWSGHDRSVG